LKEKPSTAGEQFAIRDYRASDFERLWQIDQVCFPEGIAYTQMDLTGFLVQRNAIALVAESQPAVGTAADAIVGYVIAHRRKNVGRIMTLDVLPQARGFGLGSRLMEICEQRLRSSSCDLVYLETAVNNEPALRLYQKLGYEILRTIPEYYSSHALDAFRMGKRL